MNKIFSLVILLMAAHWGFAVSFQPCNLDELKEQANCTTVEVFENHTNKGRKIPVHIAILKGTGARISSDPIVVFAGGPGQAAAELADFVAEHFAALRSDHDLVFIDARGTGGSNPLKCNLYGPDIQNYFGDLFPVDKTRECLAELEKHADLKLYTTSDIVKDIEEIRKELNYGKLNLYGTSYGTRVALVYMRMYPDAIRSVILHGPAPTDLKAPLYHAWAGQQSIEDIFRNCDADPGCHEAFPEIRKEFSGVLQQLNQGIAVEISDPSSKKPVTVKLTRGVFGEALRNMLYNPNGAGRVPLLIHLASQGNFRAFAEFNLVLRKNYQEHLAFGMFHSVCCAEDVPFITNEDVERETKNTFLQDYRIAQQQQACTVWPRADLPSGFHEPVRSGIPTLVITGEFDPVTAPKFGKEIAESLSNAKNLVIKGAGHSGMGACVDSIMVDFVRNPDPKQIDESCLAKEPNRLTFETSH